MPSGSAPLPVRLYGAAANLLAPLAYARVKRKLSGEGVDPHRLPERLGHATAPRPDGDLLWFHAASVGESLSVLRLITHLGNQTPDLSFLLTSGTATSAKIVADRLPPRTTHQFAPLDTKPAMTRFLDHWRPSAAVFVESELWPQMLSFTASRDIPLALINARISDRSARNWKRFDHTAKFLMSQFTMIHCQDTRTAHHLHDLGLTHAKTGVNLKSLSGALPYDTGDLQHLREVIKDRPVWLAASTHPGEDEIALQAQVRLRQKHSKALLILIPRHPERAASIETMIAASGLTYARRSTGSTLTKDTAVYLADTLGEMGLWYALAPLTCLCGSFTDVGGHNPYEPAYAGSAILHGPLYRNFADTYAALDASGGGIEVTDATALADTLSGFLKAPDTLSATKAKARAFANAQEDVLDSFAGTLSNALGLRYPMV